MIADQTTGAPEGGRGGNLRLWADFLVAQIIMVLFNWWTKLITCLDPGRVDQIETLLLTEGIRTRRDCEEVLEKTQTHPKIIEGQTLSVRKSEYLQAHASVMNFVEQALPPPPSGKSGTETFCPRCLSVRTVSAGISPVRQSLSGVIASLFRVRYSPREEWCCAHCGYCWEWHLSPKL